MNNFLEKLTNNVDIEPVAQEYIDFLLSCNKGKVAFTHRDTGKVIYRDASFSDKDYILGTKRPWATEHWYNSETGEPWSVLDKRQKRIR